MEAVTLRARTADIRDAEQMNELGPRALHEGSAAGASALGLGDPVQRTLSVPARRASGQNGRRSPMPTYIMLSTLTPEGVQTVKNNPQRITEVNKEVEQLGATVKAQWATLGHVDFISIIEAPDEGTMARVSLELGSRGTGRYETLSAIPVEEFIASL
jgi:uncharacterized protein with GYD domain